MKRERTYSAKASEIKRKWFLLDAKGRTLGRVATKVAGILMGKGKVMYTPHLDTGDFVVLINASFVNVTGKKETQKTYFSHSGYPAGDKLLNFKYLIQKDPARDHQTGGLGHAASEQAWQGDVKETQDLCGRGTQEHAAEARIH